LATGRGRGVCLANASVLSC